MSACEVGFHVKACSALGHQFCLLAREKSLQQAQIKEEEKKTIAPSWAPKIQYESYVYKSVCVLVSSSGNVGLKYSFLLCSIHTYSLQTVFFIIIFF